MGRRHNHSTDGISAIVLCLIGGAVISIPVLGLGPLIAVALGLALGYGALDQISRLRSLQV